MNTIYVPTFAANKNDVKNMFSLLETEVLKNYSGKLNIGLEICGRPEHFTNQMHLDNIVANIKEVAGGAKTIVHGFSTIAVYTEGIADMSKTVGEKLLATYIDLAKKLGSEYVHVHSSVGYQGIQLPEDKPKIIQSIRKSLLNGSANSDGISVGIENLPSPSGCDCDINPKTVWRDYIEGVDDCMNIIQDTSLKMTFDTCHWGINQESNPDIISPLKYIGNYLGHIHASDCRGFWKPDESLAYEGFIFGEGKIGETSFKNFFEYIKENYSDIGICLEINNKDFNNPEETRESIKRLCNWLI